MKNASEMIQNFTETCQDANFIAMCAEAAKQLGITAEQWNKDRMAIVMMFYAETLGK